MKGAGLLLGCGIRAAARQEQAVVALTRSRGPSATTTTESFPVRYAQPSGSARTTVAPPVTGSSLRPRSLVRGTPSTVYVPAAPPPGQATALTLGDPSPAAPSARSTAAKAGGGFPARGSAESRVVPAVGRQPVEASSV